MTKLSFLCSMAVLVASRSTGAVSMQVTGQAGESSVTFSWSGSFELYADPDGTGSNLQFYASLPRLNEVGSNPGSYSPIGQTPFFNGVEVESGWTSSPSTFPHFLADVSSFRIEFVRPLGGGGETILGTYEYDSIFWNAGSSGAFGVYSSSGQYSYPGGILQNDFARFSGSMSGTLPGADTFGTFFNLGSFSDPDGYNGQDFTIEVANTPIPEPSSALIATMGALSALCSRRRMKSKR